MQGNPSCICRVTPDAHTFATTGGRELAHAGKLLARQGEQSVRHCPDGDPRTRAKPKLVEDVLHVIAGRAL